MRRPPSLKHSLYQVSPIVGGCLIMTSSGSVYLVAAYSSKLQMLLGMTTGEISTFGTLVAAGSWLGIVPYAFTDKFGPKITLLIGIAMLMSGYITIATIASQSDGSSGSSHYLVIACGFLVGFGSSWTHASTLVTNAANTSIKQRGAVIGLLQANFALSSGIYTQFLQIFSLYIPHFLILTGCLMGLSDVVAYPLNNHIISDEVTKSLLETDKLFIKPLALLTSLTACFVALASVLNIEVFHYCVILTYFILFISVLILSTKLTLVYKLKVFLFRSFHKSLDDEFKSSLDFGKHEIDNEKVGLLNNDEDLALKLQSDKTPPSQSSTSYVELWAYASSVSFMIMFFCYTVGVGSGLTVLDNITKIVDAHSAAGSDDDVHSSLKTNAVALFSAFNTFGRIIFGFSSDWLLLNKGISRSSLLSFNCLLMASATIIMAYIKLSLLNYAIMLTALSYGGFLMLIPTLVADFYGFKCYGSMLGLMNLAPMIGTEVFYNILSSFIYDKEGQNLTCFHDAACFRWTFIILSSCCLFASILAALMPRDSFVES